MTKVDLTAISSAFAQELQKATQGVKTSLPFIENPLPTNSLVQDSELFQVLVIGGSICKTALVRSTNNNIIIESQQEQPQPSFTSEAAFLAFIEDKIEPSIATLCVNFAYPLKPTISHNYLDGELLSGSKENTFGTLVSKTVGDTISEYLLQKLHKKIQVTVANDTICTLLSGKGNSEWNKLACGIVGTGVNFALFSDSQTAINLESGNFDRFTTSAEVRQLDKQSSYPGTALFEKETAGAYLYQHYNILASRRTPPFPTITSTKELSELVQTSSGARATLAQTLLHKSAQLVACQIAGITTFKKQPMTFVMEGSFFWESYHYKETIEDTLRELRVSANVSIIHVPDSPIVGGARLALS